MRTVFQKLSSWSAIWVLVLICLASFSLMLWGALTDAAITDEIAHIPAGYGYVHNLDYRLNPEHPPLVKALAALPLLFLNPVFPTSDRAWITDVNGQWDMGGKLLYGSPSNDANQIVRLARFGPILLTILLIILIYIWSRELLGRWWALLPTFLFALSPTVLAHGHYVTTDVGAAFGVVVATYYFLKFLEHPSQRHLIYAGLAFGVAQLMKFSTVLLVPFFAVLILVFWLRDTYADRTNAGQRFKKNYLRGLRLLKSLIIIFVIGYVVVVYPVYFLFTVNYPITKQHSDTEFILGSFAHGPTPAGQPCHGMRCLADLNIRMSKSPALRPFAEYLLGILMVIQRAAGGNTAYFLGEVSGAGSHFYFPIVYLLKEPLPVLMMTLLALAITLRSLIRGTKRPGLSIKRKILDYLGTNFTEFSMTVFIMIYWAWSVKNPLNIGFRHLMPTIPFIYILTSGVWKRWITKIELPRIDSMIELLKSGAKAIAATSFKYVFLVLLLVWFFAETVFAAPYFLSYFNEAAGGIAHGYRYVTDSNYDWGQDLLRLSKFVAAHPEIDKIAVDYFGGGNPKYYLGDCDWPTKKPLRSCAENWWSARGNPSDSGIHWLAVSVNTLQGTIQPPANGFKRKPEDEYRWLTELRPSAGGPGNVPEPDFRAGSSIFVYKL